MEKDLKIYVKGTPLIITDNVQKYENDGGILPVQVSKEEDVKDVLEYLESSPFHSKAVLHGASKAAIYNHITQQSELLQASGGVVWNDLGQVLLIFRHNHWDLPKGKIEENESKEEAALREVMEECGVQELALNNYFTTTYHTYWRNQTRMLKQTFWYEMACNDKGSIKPQTIEGITDVKWANQAAIQKAMQQTFPNLQEVLENVFNKM